jgi:hypothetical protein
VNKLVRKNGNTNHAEPCGAAAADDEAKDSTRLKYAYFISNCMSYPAHKHHQSRWEKKRKEKRKKQAVAP